VRLSAIVFFTAGLAYTFAEIQMGNLANEQDSEQAEQARRVCAATERQATFGGNPGGGVSTSGNSGNDHLR
jgi:hypothetical protein